MSFWHALQSQTAESFWRMQKEDAAGGCGVILACCRMQCHSGVAVGWSVTLALQKGVICACQARHPQSLYLFSPSRLGLDLRFALRPRDYLQPLPVSRNVSRSFVCVCLTHAHTMTSICLMHDVAFWNNAAMASCPNAALWGLLRLTSAVAFSWNGLDMQFCLAQAFLWVVFDPHQWSHSHALVLLSALSPQARHVGTNITRSAATASSWLRDSWVKLVEQATVAPPESVTDEEGTSEASISSSRGNSGMLVLPRSGTAAAKASLGGSTSSRSLRRGSAGLLDDLAPASGNEGGSPAGGLRGGIARRGRRRGLRWAREQGAR